MKTILTSYCHKLGTIRTIPKPEGVASAIDDLPDLKLLVKKQGGPFELLYFQFDLSMPEVEAMGADQAAQRLYKAMWQDINSRRFADVHGHCMPAPPKENTQPQKVRVMSIFERLVRHSLNSPRIIYHNVGAQDGHEISLRLPRGVHVKLFHHSLRSLIEKAGRQHDGVITMHNQLYRYFVWRPMSITVDDIPHDLLKQETLNGLTRSFSFLDVSGFEMSPNPLVEEARANARIEKEMAAMAREHFGPDEE